MYFTIRTSFYINTNQIFLIRSNIVQKLIQSFVKLACSNNRYANKENFNTK